MQRSQAEQTVNGDYEFLEDYTFDSVDYKRFMSWKKGEGNLTVGIRVLQTDSDVKNLALHAGWSVIGKGVDFKLTKTIV